MADLLMPLNILTQERNRGKYNCHPELISGSGKTKMLKLVQHDITKVKQKRKY